MTGYTKGDEILLNVPSHLASKLKVMNFECLPCSTILAPPAVSLQDFAAQSPVFFRVKLSSRPLGFVVDQEFSPRCSIS